MVMNDTSDPPGSTLLGVDQLQRLFDTAQQQKDSLKEFVIALKGPAPSIDDDAAYVAWVSDCAQFFYEQPDPPAMMIVIEALCDDHPKLRSIVRHPYYPHMISQAYLDGPEKIRETLLRLGA